MRYKSTIVNPPTIFFFARSAALCALKFGVYKLSPNSDDWLDALFLGASDNFFSALRAFPVIKIISSIIILFDNDTVDINQLFCRRQSNLPDF
jgi:hypothetical protein